MRRWAAVLAVPVLLSLGCSGDEEDATEPSAGRPSIVGQPAPDATLFSPEGNNLWAYGTAAAESAPPRFAQQLVNQNHDEDPDGWDINGQVCTLGDGRIIAGEDTGQPNPPAGWGVFQVEGAEVGDLTLERVARLVPPFPDGDEEPDTYGCGVLGDDRVVTTTIGNQALGPGNGQLILWFPPFDSRDGSGIAHCVLADGIATAQQVWVDADDRIYVASARPPTSGIWRYPAPEAHDADSCEALEGELIVTPDEENQLVSPNGVTGSLDGTTLYVSSIINGVIAELDADGTFRRLVLAPPEGEELGAESYSTGTPLGLVIDDATGTLYYADLGLAWPPGEDLPGPAPGRGSVRRITFVEGEPQPPDVINDGLTFPDGVGLWRPGG
jgi:hypothetical protein